MFTCPKLRRSVFKRQVKSEHGQIMNRHTVVAVVLLLALSFHSVLAGIALGAGSMRGCERRGCERRGRERAGRERESEGKRERV